MNTSPPLDGGLDGLQPLFNPHPEIRRVALPGGSHCHVIDNALLEPERLVDWAAAHAFHEPPGYPYPGLVQATPAGLNRRLIDHFSQHLRSAMGARRTQDGQTRFSLVTTPPEDLEPRQWLCHRDRIAANPREVLFAASVLYLFKEPALGGTSFYEPKQGPAQTDQLVADSQVLGAADFARRYGLQPSYMGGSNAYFERVARVPAAWNRAIFYDATLFHSADVDQPALMSAEARRGRLTLNGFFTCTRKAS
jgi:hypothetical protein